jgi:hypothetical protein
LQARCNSGSPLARHSYAGNLACAATLFLKQLPIVLSAATCLGRSDHTAIDEERQMGRLDWLVLKICLGMFAVANFIACIITTDIKVLVPLNVLVALLCFCIFLFMESKVSGLSRDFGISKRAARKLIGNYFAYYKNVERITIDEYLERTSRPAEDN